MHGDSSGGRRGFEAVGGGHGSLVAGVEYAIFDGIAIAALECLSDELRYVVHLLPFGNATFGCALEDDEVILRTGTRHIKEIIAVDKLLQILFPVLGGVPVLRITSSSSRAHPNVALPKGRR